MKRARVSRVRATRERRSKILEAVLECSSELGYQQTTMAEIRRRADASTGSIYHHFGGKQGLFAALYLEGIRETQEIALRLLQQSRSGEEGVRRLVSGYLEWVAANPALAAYLQSMRNAEFLSSAESELAALNRRFFRGLRDWMEPWMEAGELPRLEPDVYLSVLFGATEHFTRQWLRGVALTDLQVAQRQLADAAWAGLCALAGR